MSQSIEQLSLPLFGQRSFADLVHSRAATNLTICYNKRIRRGWNVRISRATGARTLTVPGYLQDAPEEIKSALIEWALLPDPRRRDRKRLIKERQLELERRVWEHVESLGIRRGNRHINPEEIEKHTQGCIHDLRQVFDSVNKFYFDGKVQSVVRWGSPTSVTSFQTTRRDSNGHPVQMITIAGVYNHPEVPLYALEGVMHHEILHIVIPPRIANGRNVIHGPEFRKAEQSFSRYAAWRLWERECLPALAAKIRSAHRRRKNKK